MKFESLKRRQVDIWKTWKGSETRKDSLLLYRNDEKAGQNPLFRTSELSGNLVKYSEVQQF